jgi:hypothetical protein
VPQLCGCCYPHDESSFSQRDGLFVDELGKTIYSKTITITVPGSTWILPLPRLLLIEELCRHM